jgi:electron transport complex protein RnfG
MTDQTKTSKDQKSRNLKMLRAMVGIGSVCALLIVFTYEATFSQIEQNKAEALEKAIFKVLPEVSSYVTYEVINQELSVSKEKPENPLVYGGYDDQDQLVGFAVLAQGQGYADILRILYGYDPQKEIINGFIVLESKETPGLGDKIEKDAKFLANFDGLEAKMNESKSTLTNPIVTVKSGEKTKPWEIDGITGATISSRAIGNIIGSSSVELLPVLYKSVQTNSVTQKPEL